MIEGPRRIPGRPAARNSSPDPPSRGACTERRASTRPAKDPQLMHALVTFLAFAATLTCQQVQRTAHPQESIQNNNGTLLPFGCLSPTAFTEGRTQILIRDQELPGPGAILVGLEVHCEQ